MTRQADHHEETVDAVGNVLHVGDLVIANIRDYHRSPGAWNSGSSRRLVKGIITGFVGPQKVRMEVADGLGWDSSRWLGTNHTVLIAPKAMVETYNEAYSYFTEGLDETESRD